MATATKLQLNEQETERVEQLCAEFDPEQFVPEWMKERGDSAELWRLTCEWSGTNFATLALQAGVPDKVVSEILGHASAADLRHLQPRHPRHGRRRH